MRNRIVIQYIYKSQRTNKYIENDNQKNKVFYLVHCKFWMDNGRIICITGDKKKNK